MNSRRSTLKLVRFVLLLAVSLPSIANAELLDTEELAGCEVHCVGMYSPEDHQSDDRVYVSVQKSDTPMVLVLSSYFGANWNVEIHSDTNVKQIIVAGYFKQSIKVTPDGPPVEIIAYFPDQRRDFFYAYSWHTDEGRKLKSRIKELTGLPVDTFQGNYSARRLVVDGKRGLLGEKPAEDPQPDSAAIRLSVEARELLLDARIDARKRRAALVAEFAAEHPSVKKIDQLIERLDQKLADIAGSEAQTASDQADSKSAVESLVRETFYLQTQLQLARIEKAEADLNRIKRELKDRQENAESIIAKRVAEVEGIQKTKNHSGEGIDASHSAERLTAFGWAAWRKQDWESALPKFQAAVKKDPSLRAARNGLGWTHLHLGEYDLAIEQFKLILKEMPDHAGAKNGLGQSYLAQGKLSDAERVLLEATNDAIKSMGEKQAVSAASWYGLIRTYMQQKDYESAHEWAERFLKHEPNELIQSMAHDAEEKMDGSKKD